MFLSAKTIFEDPTKSNISLLFRAETNIPRMWSQRFLRNVRLMDQTPQDTGALRRSIITYSSGGEANIGWRSAYARAQEYGGHDYPGQYSNYTKAGTGPFFGRNAYARTLSELPSIVRETGLIK